MWHLVMERKVPLWKVKSWEKYPWLIQGFTTRASGNLALHTGEEEQIILSNRQKVSSNLGVQLASWVTGNQVHETNIEQVLIGDRGKGANTQSTAFTNTDGLSTDQANILLASFYADCVPLFFIEPRKQIIAMAHAGWRGTASSIGTKMLDHFQTIYKIDPREIEIAIGPSIGPCCYQVGEEVAKQFPLNSVLHKKDGIYLDLWQANLDQFLKAGISLKHVFMASVCTYCNQDFYSYRREHAQAGRMAALLGKKHL